MYRVFIKRLIDVILSLGGLILLSPLIILITAILFVSNKGKPFFIQARPGKNEKIFRIIKFKTMNDAQGESGNLLSDEKRLTRIGQFIRKHSLDEIPQLFNVLKGDMSLVGPRPLLPEYLSLYNKEQSIRHLVRPGITGLAQVCGRNILSWEQKFNADIYYVKKLSFKLDLKILLLTILKVFGNKGVSKPGFATTEKFTGGSKNRSQAHADQ